MENLPVFFITDICLPYHAMHIQQLLITILQAIVEILSRKQVEMSLLIKSSQNCDVRPRSDIT